MKAKRYNYFFLSLLTICSMLLMSAQNAVPSEYQVKAVFLFNFSQFAEWPSTSFTSDQTPLVIGVLGKNPFGSYIESVVAGEKANGRPVVVEHYKNISEVKTCHILFIHKSEEDNMGKIIKNIKGRSILTVSDSPNFIEQGGMIRFVTRNNKIKLQINPETAKANSIIISSQLLRLAEIVEDN